MEPVQFTVDGTTVAADLYRPADLCVGEHYRGIGTATAYNRIWF